MQKAVKNQWSSRWMFILAATGSAVGLGNIWKFPYITGENGGGAFVLVYLLCVALIGIPVMMAEIMLGRRGGGSPINTMRVLAKEAKRHPIWGLLGWMGMLAGIIILSYYSVIAGWTLAYIPLMASDHFHGMDAQAVADTFDAFTGNPWWLLLCHTAIIFLTLMVVAKGVCGLEKAVRFLMPALFLILLILDGYAYSRGAFSQGLDFLFASDFSKLSANSVLIAMGHAFFTLSLGMGAIMVYGAYLPKEVSITQVSITIAAADTLVALLAGIAIFPIVFANGLPADSGPGLIFTTLPLAFSHMAGGAVFGSLFFVLLLFAALTSTISLVEPAVAWLGESKGMSRKNAAILCGIFSWALGLLTVFSFNKLSDVKPLFDKTFFDIFDYLAANILLPLGGLAIAVFAAWSLDHHMRHDELNTQHDWFVCWLFVLRYITPIAIFIIFLHAIGIFA